MYFGWSVDLLVIDVLPTGPTESLIAGQCYVINLNGDAVGSF